jgi:hypothetical protein
MNQGSVIAAVIIAVGLIAASVLIGGIYETRGASENAAFMWRVNRFTGAMAVCSVTPPGDQGNTFAPVCTDVPAKKSN